MALGTSSDLVVVTRPIEMNGATLNVQDSGGLATGNYEIISFTSLTGTNLSIGSLPPGFTGTIVNNPARAIWLDVVKSTILTWTGPDGRPGTPPRRTGRPAAARPPIATACPSCSTTAPAPPPTAACDHRRDGPAGVDHGQQQHCGLHVLRGRQHCRSTSLTKSGAGLLEINMANNTYSGGTNLTAGVLQVDFSTTSPQQRHAGQRTAGRRGHQRQRRHLAGHRPRHAGQRRQHQRQRHAGRPDLQPATLSTPNTVTITGTPTINVTSPVTINDQIVGRHAGHGGPQHADPHRGDQ